MNWGRKRKTENYSPKDPFLSESSYLLKADSGQVSASLRPMSRPSVLGTVGRRQHSPEGEGKAQAISVGTLALLRSGRGTWARPCTSQALVLNHEVLVRIELNSPCEVGSTGGGDRWSLQSGPPHPPVTASFPCTHVWATLGRTSPSPLTSVTVHMLFWNVLPFLLCALDSYSFNIQVRVTSLQMPSVTHTNRAFLPRPPTAAYSAQCILIVCHKIPFWLLCLFHKKPKEISIYLWKKMVM